MGPDTLQLIKDWLDRADTHAGPEQLLELRLIIAQTGDRADRLDPEGQTIIRDAEDYEADQKAAINRQAFKP